MSSLTAQPTTELFNHSLDPVEEEIQELFALIERASPEAKTKLIIRLIQGMATKVNATYAEGVVKAGQSIDAPKKPTNTTNRISPWPGAGRNELHDVFDPIEGWKHFGEEAYHRILHFEPTPILNLILAHPKMPQGKDPTKKASSIIIAKLIIERLKKYFSEN